MKSSIFRRAWLLLMFTVPLYGACSGEAQTIPSAPEERPRLADYEFSFQLSSKDVIAYQGLWVREFIRNTSAADLPQPDFMLGGTVLDIWLTDSSGAKVYVPIPHGSGSPFTSAASVPSGDSLLVYHYFANSLWDATCGEKCLLTPGEYKIMIGIERRLFSDYDQSAPDSLVSLPFTIRAASSLESRAQARWREALQLFVERDYAASESACREIVDEDTASPLLETAYRHMYYIETNVPPRGKAMEDWVALGREIVERIPESPLCRKVARQLKDRLEAASFDSLLERVSVTCPKSPILEIDFEEP